MYFSSDSWGKFGKGTTEDYMKAYFKDVPFNPITTESELLAEVVGEYFNKPIPQSIGQLELLKHLLEGIRMPVTNPKTGEQDYVDIDLVDKIVVDSQYVEDIISNNKIKFDVKLSGNKATNQVNIKISSQDLGLEYPKQMPLQQFEEMVFAAVNETKEQRLEDVNSFSTIIDEMMNTLVDSARSNKSYVARLNQKYVLDNGIGIIRDIKTNQEVGTFEALDYTYQRNERTTNISGIILSGRSFDDLEEKDRFKFAYYSLENNIVYSIMASTQAAIKSDSDLSTVDLRNYDLIIDSFDESHGAYKTAVNAQEKKSLLVGITDDNGNPVDSVKMEQFRQSRLDILEESKNRQKQEKIISQFNDIDLGI
jgi:hypothetical protein